jgi:hypothetical protein
MPQRPVRKKAPKVLKEPKELEVRKGVLRMIQLVEKQQPRPSTKPKRQHAEQMQNVLKKLRLRRLHMMPV